MIAAAKIAKVSPTGRQHSTVAVFAMARVYLAVVVFALPTLALGIWWTPAESAVMSRMKCTNLPVLIASGKSTARRSSIYVESVTEMERAASDATKLQTAVL
jgi:hypothetical protein